MAFFQKRKTLPPELLERLPPGQHLALGWPVLTHGTVPEVTPDAWVLRITGEVEAPVTLTWDDLMQLPQLEVIRDFHCVTHWTKLDNRWNGVPVRALLTWVRPTRAATHVMAQAYGGYCANLPLDVLDDDDVLLATGHNGACLAPEHGFPVRLVVPKRYGWKSVKWLCELVFMQEDRPGYWERNGYHNEGDPWKEQRYGPRRR